MVERRILRLKEPCLHRHRSETIQHINLVIAGQTQGLLGRRALAGVPP